MQLFRPTFRKVVKWKSTREFSGIPYVVMLFNSLLWVYYGTPVAVHPNAILVSTINGAGCVLEIVYIAIFLLYANPKERISNGSGAFLGACQLILYAKYYGRVHPEDQKDYKQGAGNLARRQDVGGLDVENGAGSKHDADIIHAFSMEN
ncbi:hypothetical protein L7F22_017255 [Adiantum nelumboides]|nr:hypothetical protein [Adiantum nelumboides]